MLRVRDTTYHFRRIVPPTLRAALNRREIWVFLKTGHQNEARKRSSLFHARTLERFMHAHSVLAEPDALSRLEELLVSLQDLPSVILPSPDSGNGVRAGISSDAKTLTTKQTGQNTQSI